MPKNCCFDEFFWRSRKLGEMKQLEGHQEQWRSAAENLYKDLKVGCLRQLAEFEVDLDHLSSFLKVSLDISGLLKKGMIQKTRSGIVNICPLLGAQKPIYIAPEPAIRLDARKVLPRRSHSIVFWRLGLSGPIAYLVHT